MNAKIHDYSENNTPNVHLTKPIQHPMNITKVIGHSGFDKERGVQVATFPRKRDEHWFRGESTSGLTGYGISETILSRLARDNHIDRVLIIETDNSRVIEYDFASFTDATVVAFAPDLEECVIGDDAMRVDPDVYHDRQRVVPVPEARQTFDRDDVRISR